MPSGRKGSRLISVFQKKGFRNVSADDANGDALRVREKKKGNIRRWGGEKESDHAAR